MAGACVSSAADRLACSEMPPRGRSLIRLGPERVIAGVLRQLGDALDLAQPGGQLEADAVRRRAGHQPQDRAQRGGVENADVFEVEDQVIEAARAKLADLRLELREGGDIEVPERLEAHVTTLVVEDADAQTGSAHGPFGAPPEPGPAGRARPLICRAGRRRSRETTRCAAARLGIGARASGVGAEAEGGSDGLNTAKYLSSRDRLCRGSLAGLERT